MAKNDSPSRPFGRSAARPAGSSPTDLRVEREGHGSRFVQGDGVPARDAEIPRYQPQGNPLRGPRIGPKLPDLVADVSAELGDFPVFSLWIRFPGSETGSHETAPTARYPELPAC